MRSILQPGEPPVEAPAGEPLPCAFLCMQSLNAAKGFFLGELLTECERYVKSEEHPFGNRQQKRSFLSTPDVQTTLTIIRLLLEALQTIHRSFLHGDISPGNIFIDGDLSSGKLRGVVLLDFGSAQALKNGKAELSPQQKLYTTAAFCAPEIRRSGAEKVILTPAADTYAAARLLKALLHQYGCFYLRRHDAANLERTLDETEALRETDANPSTRRVLPALNDLLRGALSPNPERRMTLDKMMEEVDQLYRKLQPPAWKMRLGLPQLNGDEVLGREKNVGEIEAELQNNQKANGKLVLHGFSGIGKTKLVTLLGYNWAERYPGSQVYYAFYPGSMINLVLDTLGHNISTVHFTEMRNGKEEPRLSSDIIDDVFQELNIHMNEGDLLIIDNVDDDTKKHWNSVVHGETVQGQTDLFTRLCQLNCKVLFVTRLDVSNVTGIVPFEVDRLEPEPLRAILRENSKDANGHSDAQKRSDEELDGLINLVDHHTMTVDMIARTMRESELTVPEIYDELRRDDYGSDAFVEINGQKDTDYSEGKIEGHLIRLFRLANFNEWEQDVLRYAQLIGENNGMYKTLFLSCCPHKVKGKNAQNLSALNHLIRLGYVQQKKEGDSEKIILNLHTLVRVVTKKVLPLEEKLADSFLDAMPLPYRGYGADNSDLLLASIAESYIQAREVVGKETILFGYWSSCASVWLVDARKMPFTDGKKNVERFIEYLSDAVRIYNALKKGDVSLKGVQNAQKKVLCLHWNIWRGLSYATPGMVRQKCGTSEAAQKYWTFCIGEPERNPTYPALFQEYQKCADLWEEVRQKLVTEFHPENYSDYWSYTNLVDVKEQIRTEKEIQKNFERKTVEDYKHYLSICRWLRINAEDLNAANGMEDSQSEEELLLEQQEKRATREYLEILEEQSPIEYKKIIQVYQDYISCCRRNPNKEVVELYCKNF